MSKVSAKARDLELERQLRQLVKLFQSQGFAVRREKLASGPSYKVKSGDCLLGGNRLIFVDRRLSVEQQLGVVLEYLFNAAAQFKDADLSFLSPANQDVFRARCQNL